MCFFSFHPQKKTSEVGVIQLILGKINEDSESLNYFPKGQTTFKGRTTIQSLV